MNKEILTGLEKNLQNSLRTLALPPGEQERVTSPGCVTCDLYEDFRLDFELFMKNFGSKLIEEQKIALQFVSDKLEEVPDEAFECFSIAALEHPAWEKVRSAAAEALKQMGWTVETPSAYKEKKPGVWKRE